MKSKSFGGGRYSWTIRAVALFGGALASVYVGCASATRAFDEGDGGDGGDAGSASSGGGIGGGSGCGAGLTLCGAMCVDLTSDEASCGACGKACSAGEECSAGMCGPPCMGSEVKCNGICTDVTADAANCGGCDKPCGPDMVCDLGVCGPVCDSGGSLCDGVCVHTATDPMNCGDCGVKCAAGEVCAGGLCSQCNGGAVLKSAAPSGSMVLCDHPADSVCEENAETLCPTGWGLCTYLQHKERSAGWTFALGPSSIAIGEIYCRNGGGAGHFTLPDSGGQPATLEGPAPFNCYYGSSTPACTSNYGCNEQSAMALCCAPAPACGNGVVDSAEEDCDDGNLDETDDCLNSCAWRLPAQHGYSGTNCQ
ncbi:MAG: hypothetical protein HUU21_32505 [Polyangiaceae bacterium]|nr:hypothetical protein [Polyangiaceae bacterium]